MKCINLKFTANLIVLSLSTALFLSSCASKKDVVYFQDTGDYETIVSNNKHVGKFKVDDVVSINVSTFDPTASMPFNLYKGTVENGARPEQIDYIIDKNGEIEFPVVGAIKIVGLSSEEAKALIKEKLKLYLKDPIVNIRLQNFTVTILGAVNRPGTYPVNGEQITILEALGLAGDLDIKGRRDNVMVTRDFNGTKVYTRVDLTRKATMNSPVFYLTQNDVVYVEPNKSGITSSSLDGRASLWVAVLSTLLTTSVLIITSNNR